MPELLAFIGACLMGGGATWTVKSIQLAMLRKKTRRMEEELAQLKIMAEQEKERKEAEERALEEAKRKIAEMKANDPVEKEVHRLIDYANTIISKEQD